jgi:hypothetical protein
MGFLDNLENSLKSLESQEERDPNEARRRQDERTRTLAAAPWATQLKESDYTKTLFEKAAVRGHELRSKIYMAWFDTVLRLEMRGRVLELKPTANGIVAEYADAKGDMKRDPVDLGGDPDELLKRWIGSEQRTIAVKEEREEDE